MTKKEFFTAVANGEMNEELMTTAGELLKKLNVATANSRNRATKARAEKTAARLEAEAPIVEKLIATLTSEPQSATQLIANAGVEVTPQKLSMMFREAVASGRVIKEKIKGEKGKIIGYKIG